MAKLKDVKDVEGARRLVQGLDAAKYGERKECLRQPIQKGEPVLGILRSELEAAKNSTEAKRLLAQALEAIETASPDTIEREAIAYLEKALQSEQREQAGAVLSALARANYAARISREAAATLRCSQRKTDWNSQKGPGVATSNVPP